MVLVIFFAGFKANGYLWSARYEKLEASHAQAIAEQRERLLSRQERINDATAEREESLLRELEIQRESYALLQANIDATPLVRERIVRVPVAGETPQCPPAPSIDWSAFGRLYDDAAVARPAAEAEPAAGGDAAGAPTSDSG